jgi:HK97 family phage major capsid protein
VNAPIDEARARKREIAPRLKELADMTRAHTETEAAEWRSLTEEFDALEAREAELADRAERAAKASKVFESFNVNTRTGGNPHDVDVLRAAPDELRGRAMDAIERSKLILNDTFKEEATATVSQRGSAGRYASQLSLVTGTWLYERAWAKYMSGQGNLLQPDEARELERAQDVERAMTAGTGSSGGYYVPLYLDPTFVITGAGSYAQIRDVANVKQISTLTYNGATAAQVTAGWLGENSAVSDNTPSIAQVQIPTYKATLYVPASLEAFEDIDNLAADVGMLFADAKANLEATAFLTGSGSSQPKGVMTAVSAVTASRVSPATGGTIAAVDIFTVHTALPARQRYADGRHRAWMANVAVIDKVRQFGTSNVYYMFTSTGTEGAPAALLGDQLIEASGLSSSITTGQDVLIYGDFSRYYIIDRVGLTTEFVPVVFDQATGRPSGTRAWLAHWRVGADCADTSAFRDLRL